MRTSALCTLLCLGVSSAAAATTPPQDPFRSALEQPVPATTFTTPPEASFSGVRITANEAMLPASIGLDASAPASIALVPEASVQLLLVTGLLGLTLYARRRTTGR